MLCSFIQLLIETSYRVFTRMGVVPLSLYHIKIRYCGSSRVNKASLCIPRFLELIPDSSGVLHAEVLDSSLRMMAYASKCSQSCLRALRVLIGVYSFTSSFSPRCCFIQTQCNLPISLTYSSPHALQEIRYIVPEVKHSPSQV